MRAYAVLLLCVAGAAQAAGAVAPAPFLWEVTGPKTHHYLLGSVHMLPESAYPLPAALEAAYTAADALVLESDLAALTSAQLQAQMLARGKSVAGLKQEIGAPLYQRVQDYASAHQLPPQLCDAYKAWLCALMLEVVSFQQAGGRSDLGLDQHFFKQALAANKSILWLESPQTQMDLFADMPKKAALEMLEGGLDEKDSEGGTPEDLLAAWQAGDVTAVEKLVEKFRKEQPALYDRVLAARNRNWMPRLLELMQAPRTQLVVVGAAHLVGDDGLVAQLRARGYGVQAVATAAANP